MDPVILDIVYKVVGFVLVVAVICLVVWWGCKDTIRG